MWLFLVKRFDPDKLPEEHELIATYVSSEGAHRRAGNEKGFCYVEPKMVMAGDGSTTRTKSTDSPHQ